MCRTEYHAGAEAVATLLYAKRSRNEKDELKQNGILYGPSLRSGRSPADLSQAVSTGRSARWSQCATWSSSDCSCYRCRLRAMSSTLAG